MEVISQLPLADVLFAFYDRLKSITLGYVSVPRTEDEDES